MNSAFPDLIYNGILLCISIQLIIIGIIKISARTQKTLLLGLLCLIIGIIPFNNFFWGYVKESTFLTILIGGGKNIFLAPLIYLYLALIRKANGPRLIIRHLSIPILIHSTYLIIKIIFKEFYIENYMLVA